MIQIYKIKWAKKMSYLLLILLLPIFVIGQKEITLEQAILLANKHNRQLKSEKLKTQYHEAMMGTSSLLSPMDISSELGQFNSAYFDTKIGVAQSFALPKVYKQKRTYLGEQKKLSFLQLNLSELEIKYQLQLLFQRFNYLLTKESLLKTYFDLYQSFEQRASERMKAGETDVIENMLAGQQKSAVYFQLEQIKNEQKIAQLSFNLLVNDTEIYLPKIEKLTKSLYIGKEDSLSLSSHPIMKLTMQNIEIAKAKYELEKMALLPEFTVGYNNISIRGVGANDIKYNASTRFSSIGIGVALPIFRKSIKAGIQAASINENIEQSKAEQTFQAIQTNILQLKSEYEQLGWQLNQIETITLPNAVMIRDAATQQLQKGQINYIEYVTIMSQSYQIEIQYLDILKRYNDIIVELLYHTQNF